MNRFDSHDPHRVIDHIYEAALVPGQWQGAIDDVCAASNSITGALLFASARTGGRGVASASANEGFQRALALPGWAQNPRTAYALTERPDRFVCANDVFSRRVLDADPIERALNRAGKGFQVAATASSPSEEIAIFTFERALSRGPPSRSDYETLERIRPHLARAALLSARLGVDRVSTLIGALEAIGLPAAAVRADGHLVAANRAFEGSGAALPGAFGKVVIDAPGAQVLFVKALEEATTSATPTVRAIPMRAPRGAPGKVLHLIPIRGEALDVFTRAAFLLVVTTVSVSASAPDLALLRGLFDLTRKEAQLAAALASGETLHEAAVANGIRYGTARTHLEHIFQKTGARQQSQLVLLLQGARGIALAA